MTPNRIDCIRVGVYAVLGLLLCAIANGALWLAQRVLMAVWPWVQANSDRLITALLVGIVFALAAVVLSSD